MEHISSGGNRSLDLGKNADIRQQTLHPVPPRNPINGPNQTPPQRPNPSRATSDTKMPFHTPSPSSMAVAHRPNLPVADFGPPQPGEFDAPISMSGASLQGDEDDGNEDDEVDDDGVDYDDDDDDDDADDSNEIPVWVRGEQRWISGLVADTTCAQLVEALLRDDGIITDEMAVQPHRTAAVLGQYVISEKWRRVEQILDASTKVLNIWTAWGSAKSEVRLSLRKIETPPGHHHHHHRASRRSGAAEHLRNGDGNKANSAVSPATNDQLGPTTTTADHHHQSNENDSGRESPSPTASPSTIHQALDDTTRRRKHRISQHHHHHRQQHHHGDKGSAAATKPSLRRSPSKTAKPTIERLMQLILEQGETIQQQLSKLRDREHQILRIEEAKHQSREKEHGKNYLLETYLNGLNEADDGDEDEEDEDEGEGNAANRSDSGVHEGTSSPEVGQSASNLGTSDSRRPDEHQHQPSNDGFDKKFDTNLHSFRRKSISQRESKLLQHHECSKELISTGASSERRPSAEAPPSEGSAGDVAEQIEWLQKVIAINKHLQREEELVVRLTAKVRKYQSDDPSMSIGQVQEALGTVNSSLEYTTTEMERVQSEIAISSEMLDMKENVLAGLSAELDQLEACSSIPPVASEPITYMAEPPTSEPIILSHQLPTESLPVTSHIIAPAVSYPLPQSNPMGIKTVSFGEPLFRSTDPMYFEKRDCGIASINMLHLKKNLNMAPSNMKVGPKKWPNGFHKDPDSDTGLSSMGGDEALLQIGTLV